MHRPPQHLEQRKRWLHRFVFYRRLSLFEKVILANSLMLVGEAIAGLWVTSHSLESHHYLIDTSFLVLATLCSLLINVLVLRASFRPLFRLLATIRAVSAGQTEARTVTSTDPDIGTLAQAFNEMLDQLEVLQREQTTHILQAQEEERRRIARELHDETSQTLTALLIHAEVLSQRLATFPPSDLSPTAHQRLDESLAVFTELAQGTLDKLRVLAQQLRPSVLDDLGLEAALRWLVEDGRERLHLNSELRIQREASSSHSSHVPHLPSLYETTLFRIAQEGLTNSARYAQSTHVTLTLIYATEQVTLIVEDDGCGFDTTQVHNGLGIRGMRERAALLGGTLILCSYKGHGTTVQATLPHASSRQEKGLH